MKKDLCFTLIKTFLVIILLVGVFLIYAAFQSFESHMRILDALAPDGELESFTYTRYKTLQTPLALIGTCLALIVGFLLIRWPKTKTWIQTLPVRIKVFAKSLRMDRQTFLGDLRITLFNIDRFNAVVLFGIIFVAVVLRLENLHIPLSHDEAYTYNAFASRTFWHVISDYHLPNNHVFLTILIHILTQLFGNHIWIIRIPTLLAGVLTVPAAYFLTRRLYSSESALLASSMVAIFPVLIEFSLKARGYAIVSLITLLQFMLGDYIRTKKNRFAWILIVLLSSLGFYTIPIMLFPFGALYVWLLGSYFFKDTRSYASTTDFLRYWVGSGISTAMLTVVLYLPIMIFSFDRFFNNGIVAPLGWDVFSITIWVRLRNTWMDWTALIPDWMIVIGIFGLCIGLLFHKKIAKQRFPLQIAFIIWIAFLLVVRRPNMVPRMWLFVVAPLLIWSSAGIIGPLRLINLRVGKNRSLVKLAIGSVVLVMVAQSLMLLTTIPEKWSSVSSIEDSTIFLADHIQQGDLVTASTDNLPKLRYYFNRYGIPRGTIRQSGQFQRAYIVVGSQNGETLEELVPKLGYGFPAVDIDSAKIVRQYADLTIYECYPLP